jgi:hypothetical protein
VTCKAKFDEKDYTCTGSAVPAGMTMALKQTGPRTFEATSKQSGKLLFTDTYAVTPDGRRLVNESKPCGHSITSGVVVRPAITRVSRSTLCGQPRRVFETITSRGARRKPEKKLEKRALRYKTEENLVPARRKNAEQNARDPRRPGLKAWRPILTGV